MFIGHSVKAINVEFDDFREIILVNNIVFGTPFTITNSDLSAAIAAKTDGRFDGDGDFEIRLFFSPASEEQLNTINSENVSVASQTISLKGVTSQLQNRITGIRYARTQTSNKTRGLSRTGLTTSTEGDFISYSISPKALAFASGSNFNLFVFSINASNVPEALNFVVNVQSNTLTTDEDPTVSDSSESDDEDLGNIPAPPLVLESFDLDLTSIGTNESNAYNSLEAFKMKCGAIGNEGTDVCTEEGMSEFTTVILNANNSLINSLEAVKDLAKKVRDAFKKDKIITRKQGENIFKDLNCIVGLDKVAAKRLSMIDKILDMLDRKGKVINNKQFLRTNTLKDSAQDRIFKAYDECKKSLAAKLRAVNLIEQDTADKFDSDISVFGIGDNG